MARTIPALPSWGCRSKREHPQAVTTQTGQGWAVGAQGGRPGGGDSSAETCRMKRGIEQIIKIITTWKKHPEGNKVVGTRGHPDAI